MHSRRQSPTIVLAALAASLVGCVGLSTSAVGADSGPSRGSDAWTPDSSGGQVGDPCTPEAEDEPSFLGFSFQEVSLQMNAAWCHTSVCLVNHFSGRVSCPYGQEANGTPTPDTVPCATADGQTWGCCTPDNKQPVTGMVSDQYVNPNAMATVVPQCLDRTADKTVYCSCRCANVDGGTDDGAYCSCPDGFACTQFYSSLGAAAQGVAGAYCIKNGTEYDASAPICVSTCDPSLKNCGTMQLP